jgi:transcription initiation factor TFIIIB Brf1 subunit/transcription initiation factor TFIIB
MWFNRNYRRPCSWRHGKKEIILNSKVCTNCGFVVGERVVDVEKEWREFESDPDSRNKSRVGGPMNP